MTTGAIEYYEVTIRKGPTALARFASALLTHNAKLVTSYARSELEFDCIVGLDAASVEPFRERARPVYMGRPARIVEPRTPR